MLGIHAADLHLGLTRHGHATPSGGNSRIEDFGRTLDRIVAVAIEHKVAFVVLAGDTNHSRREGPQERDILARACRRLREAGIIVIILPGNHDGPSTIGDASSHALLYLQSLDIPGVYVLTQQGPHMIPTAAGPLDVVAVPYPHKRGFGTLLPELGDDARILAAGEKVTRWIESWGEGRTAAVPTILVGHFSTVAAKLGSEQTMKMTWDVSIDPRAFAAYDYVALGHIHRQQQVAPNAWYAGSPEYIDFGEAGQDKGFLLVDVRPGELPVVTHIDSEPRRLRTITFNGDDVDAIAEVPTGTVEPGDIVKLRFDTTTRPRADTISRLRAHALSLGASAVVPDWKPPKNAVTRARVVTADKDRVELMRAWLEATDNPIEPTLTAGRELLARTFGA